MIPSHFHPVVLLTVLAVPFFFGFLLGRVWEKVAQKWIRERYQRGIVLLMAKIRKLEGGK